MSVQTISRTKSAEQFADIGRTIAGGESSYARLRAGQDTVIERADGSRIWDADENVYLDYCMGYGVNLFGHGPEFIWESVQRTVAALGLHVAFPHRLTGQVGELVAALVPGVEQLRFANSGTEATQAAVRLARAATGRDLIFKFEGHYHGWADHLCAGMGAGSTARPALPDSAGVPTSALESVWTIRWNDLEALESAIAAAGDRLAGLICEIVPGSGGVLEPLPGYLQGMTDRVRAAGGLVIFDEVMTGFRLAAGGAQARYGVTPDITTLGKIIGGGMAVAAFGGSRELMRWEAENKVMHGGTYNGSPVTLAASVAVLTAILNDPSIYDRLEHKSGLLGDGITAAMRRAGVPGHVRRVGSMLQPFMSAAPATPPRDINEAQPLQPAGEYTSFCDGLERHGVYAHRYPLGRWFVSLAHTDEDIDETLEAVGGALSDME